MAKYINELNISDMRKILSFLLLLSVLENPSMGIFIKKQGSKIERVILK